MLKFLGTILDLGHLMFLDMQEKIFYYACLGSVSILFPQLITLITALSFKTWRPGRVHPWMMCVRAQWRVRPEILDHTSSVPTPPTYPLAWKMVRKVRFYDNSALHSNSWMLVTSRIFFSLKIYINYIFHFYFHRPYLQVLVTWQK